MVVSVVAMSAAFAGTAVAADNTTVEITEEIDEDGNIEANLTNGELDDGENVTVYVTAEDEDDAELADEDVALEGDEDEDEATASVKLTVDTDGLDDGDDVTVVVYEDDEHSEQADYAVTTFNTGDGEFEQDYDDAGPVWDGDADSPAYIGQEITITDDEFEGEHDVSSVILYEGPASLSDPTHETSIEIHDADEHDDLTTAWGTFETADLEPGEAYHFYIDEDDEGWEHPSDFHGAEFWTDEEDLDVDFQRNTVTEDGEAEIKFDSEREEQYINVTSEDFDGEDLYEMFVDHDEDSYPGDADHYTDDVLTLKNLNVNDNTSEFYVNFDGVDAGEYEFEFETTDSLAWDNATIEVVDADESVDFAEQSSGEVGDVIDIKLDLEYAEGGAVQISEYDETYFQAAVEFEAEDHNVDEAVIQFNANNPDDEESWRVHPDYDDEIGLIDDEKYANATFDGALGVHDYTMFAGQGLNESDATPVVDPETDTEFFSVHERTPVTDVTTSIAPIDSSLDDYDDFNETTVTEQSEVADGDALLVTLEDFGLSGVLQSENTVADELADGHIDISLVEQDPGPNVDAQTWTINETDADGDDDVHQINVSAVYTDLEHYDGDLVLQLEYDEDVIDEELELGEYDLTYEVTEDSPYIADEDDEVEIETEFEIVEPVVEWDHTVEEVPNAEDAEVSGTTTTAPGSEISTDARSAGNFTEAADAIVEEGGTFTATYDFSDQDPGIEFELGAYHDDRSSYDYDNDKLEDKVDAVLVDAEEPLINLHANAPGEVEVGDAAALDVTVSNDGGAADDVNITVTIDGEDVKDDSTTLDPDEEWSDSFDFDTSEEADISWEVTAGDNEDSGVLNVEEEAVDDDDDDSTDDDDDDDDDADETPGLGVAVAVVALLAAAMLALRRQD
ncbi:BGTF surface domain-containing protein [Natronobacterium texcoconense]